MSAFFHDLCMVVVAVIPTAHSDFCSHDECSDDESPVEFPGFCSAAYHFSKFYGRPKHLFTPTLLNQSPVSRLREVEEEEEQEFSDDEEEFEDRYDEEKEFVEEQEFSNDDFEDRYNEEEELEDVYEGVTGRNKGR
ncbi:proline-, glutamic acid- and leucine-rich protein 1-like [Thunnus albacares]|uniref:proline-, glutamic acid- and leucine-rich protein 1-like n=1 Tax=Thunnus albacares TaxID=8236 RepID=UPI001CF6DDB3|nr:proline-, glutamic acid- and leucine-rich protein 1-like [Thunnus albacares]